MKQIKSVLVILFFVMVIVPNVYVIVVGTEHFPFSNNPMFAHNVAKDDSLVSIDFVMDKEDGKRELPFEKYGLWEIRLKRFYFSNVYGSSELGSPQKNPSMTQEQFVDNNQLFFQKLTKLSQKYDSDIMGFYLVLNQYSPSGELLQSDSLGKYNADLGQFTLN